MLLGYHLGSCTLLPKLPGDSTHVISDVYLIVCFKVVVIFCECCGLDDPANQERDPRSVRLLMAVSMLPILARVWIRPCIDMNMDVDKLMS